MEKNQLLGISGIFSKVERSTTGIIKKQTFKSDFRKISKNEKMRIEVRFDDECGNRKESFAITGEIFENGRLQSCGCLHDDIEKHFPEVKELIKWHLADALSPMYYIANTLYHATNRDSNGYLKGEPCAWEKRIKFKNSPITFKFKQSFYDYLDAVEKARATLLKTNPSYPKYEIMEVNHKIGESDYPNYTFKGYAEEKWADCPFKTKPEAEEWQNAFLNFEYEYVTVISGYSKGKERNLDYARSCAVWHDATDEELCSDNLKELLEARLPKLMEEFKADMVSCGFELPDSWRVENEK